MLLLLDSLDKGNEAARKYNKDPGNPISVSWKRLRVDILQYRHMEKWMLGLPTKYSTTRALRAMFVYSRVRHARGYACVWSWRAVTRAAISHVTNTTPHAHHAGQAVFRSPARIY